MEEDAANCVTKSIKPINGETVHKICSGQVVLSLAVAIKELVENSLDAGATVVDVRLKNYGIDLIEVSDNGTGVTEDNFSALTLKYHTSKLNEYSDLLGVESFGFRGEALSSLCALSDLTITTRHQSTDIATKIEYDHKGHIIRTTPCARQVGTTVTLSNLFSTLPVRLKEFHKNVKREFNRMTQLLYAYCLISVGVKITCTNQTVSNTKTVVVATHGSKSYKDNIACVFGSKQLQSILEIKPISTTSSIKDNIMKALAKEDSVIEESVNIDDVEINLSEDSNDKDDEKLTPLSQKSQGHKNIQPIVEFDGFISSCAHGSGRSSSDRQFYYVNSRPCEPPKIMKIVNEIYKQYNPNQYPFVFLNIHMDRSSVDVNVTPDKRKVFLTKEKIILDVLKNSLLSVFESIPRMLRVENINKGSIQSQNGEVEADTDQPRIFHSFLKRFSKENAIDNNAEKENKNNSKTTADLKRKSTSMLDFVSAKTKKTHEPNQNHDKDRYVVKVHTTEDSQETNTDSPDIELELNIKVKDKNVKYEGTNKEANESAYSNSENTISDNNDSIQCPANIKQEIMFLEHTDELPETQIRNLDEVIIEKSHTTTCKNKALKNSPGKKSAVNKSYVTDKEDLGRNNRRTVTLKTSIEHIEKLAEMYASKKTNAAPDRIKFRSKIDPVSNKKCEEELSREISKDSFKNMSIIGQFNLGFIITKLDDDLFIIDQHATDEIYNFETLQKNTELTSQKLVIPQQLELTGVNEQILMDNLGIFKKNGFTFDIDENALPTKRVKLLTVPMSKNIVFGKEDIEELLFMLRESPSEHCRPSRVRSMFASRACRKSVMIGTALAMADMRRLVDHMAEIEQPWNCPHGRPTIRHLVNLAMVHTD